MLVYICGPITMGGSEVGPEHEAARLERIETAELVAAAIMHLGHEPVLTHPICRHQAALDAVGQARAMVRCLALLARCDMIAYVYGWQHSRGCCIENEHFDHEKSRVLYPTGRKLHPEPHWTRADALRILGER